MTVFMTLLQKISKKLKKHIDSIDEV